jgi:hypothetical protein
MEYIFIIIAFLCAAAAVYLVADFVIWRRDGHVTGAVITGFTKARNKGFFLPLVVFEKSDGGQQEARALRIDRFSYVLGRPGLQQVTTVIYRPRDPSKVRVYGYINIVAALFLSIPILMVAASFSGSVQAVGQVFFLLCLGIVMGGGWMVLKIIQRL